MKAEEYLESQGYEFDKGTYELWKEDYFVEHKIKEVFDLMESYANERVREYQDKMTQRVIGFMNEIEAKDQRIKELEHKLELERGISDGKNAIIESQQRREMELEEGLRIAINLMNNPIRGMELKQLLTKK